MEYTTKEILKLERLKRNWTQNQVAELLNIARGSYAKYETGDNVPTTENIIKLAQIYNVSTDYLLCHNINKKSFLKESFEAGLKTGDELGKKLLKKRRVKKPKKEI